MPRHQPAALRRQACERMLAGEAVKDVAEDLAIKMRRSIAGGVRR